MIALFGFLGAGLLLRPRVNSSVVLMKGVSLGSMGELIIVGVAIGVALSYSEFLIMLF